MTVLIGASVLLIAASAVALVFGWTGADQSLIWTSIAATAAAAVTLALAYFRSRHEPAASQSRSGSTAQQAGETDSAATQVRPEESSQQLLAEPRGEHPDVVEAGERRVMEVRDAGLGRATGYS
jgi:hypothetical protein